MSDATTATDGPTVSLKLEFGGGMELLFDNEHEHKVDVPRFYDPASLVEATAKAHPAAAPRPASGKQTDIKFLIWWMRWYLLSDKDRPELFSQGESIRPGILILINSTDWELEGELEYELVDGDEIVFISTLHGG
ncbi:Ubiquitin- modifier 1 [Microbotryomycetes sp. JL201]|nr:Ubiquitin- modifier 1 [Microbotryomycetes sp. JL201]